ncbi:MAG: ABC transporter permease [Candidatus Kapabacteria bacterium]|nr:ABC transporter permease [Candidatus Kapabacteria bacterium]
MNIDLTIALRYLRPRRFSFIGLIGILSGIGIVLGTAALIIVMSLFNGFRDVAHELMTSFGPHIRVTSTTSAPIDGASRGWSPIWRTSLVVQAPQGTSVVQGLGISADDEPTLRSLTKALVGGRVSPAYRDGVAGAIVSSGVAQSLNLYLGDTLRIVSPRQVESALTMMTLPLGTPIIVTGVFQSNASREVDAATIYVLSDVIKPLTGRVEPTEWHVRIPQPESAEGMASQIAASLGSGVRVETWQQMNRGVYDTMRLERLGSFIVLMLIIIVAAFSILVSLTMGVVEKRHDIAMLKTMGLTNAMVARVYVWQGLFIGLVSVGLGTAIGLAACYGQQTFQWISFDMSQGYLIPALPLRVLTSDVLAIAVSAIVVASCAAIYPARRAAALELISSHTR